MQDAPRTTDEVAAVETPGRVENGRPSSLAVPRDSSDAAVHGFGERYPDVRFAPVVVVIPAYNEAPCIADVLRQIPREAHGLGVDTLVVDDGSSDGTFDAAAEQAYVARLDTNLGQGSALRVGYRIARDHGADYIVT